MMPYDDDTLLANAHYIMKFPASQDETPKRQQTGSVISPAKSHGRYHQSRQRQRISVTIV